MRRMQRDQVRVCRRAPRWVTALDVLWRDRSLLQMPPPHDHVGVVECRAVQSLLGRIESHRFHAQTRQRLQMLRNGVAQKRVAITQFLLGLALVPDEHAEWVSRGVFRVAKHRPDTETINGYSTFLSMMRFLAHHLTTKKARRKDTKNRSVLCAFAPFFATLRLSR